MSSPGWPELFRYQLLVVPVKVPATTKGQILYSFLPMTWVINDPGCYGQKIIETPNIDALANNGIRFTQYYCGSPVSAPSRCVLLTGLHTGHSFIRGNHEWPERGDVWDYYKMEEDPRLEGQYPVPANTLTFSKVLQSEGYKTACMGKWGLGAPLTGGVPNKQGFHAGW